MYEMCSGTPISHKEHNKCMLTFPYCCGRVAIFLSSSSWTGNWPIINRNASLH